MTDEKPSIGDIVETESGTLYPVVGREQGGRTLQLPCGPNGATREFWPDDLTLVEQDASLAQAYRVGLDNASTEEDIADAVAALANEGFIPTAHLPKLHRVLDPDTAELVADELNNTN